MPLKFYDLLFFSIEKAVSDKTSEDDWGLIMEICDKVQQTSNGPRDVLKSLFKFISPRNPTSSVKALTVSLLQCEIANNR